MMKDFTATELDAYLKDNQPLLLDVREQWEWDKCHFENSKLLPMGQIMANIDSLDKSEEIVIICHHGIRSMQVARYFDSIGFEKVINLRGGIDAWAKQVDTLMTLY
ncbi:MAG: Sulfurtransferase [Catillopecten margaritatus gill symbiont]|uniref:Sulfurtransferase n=1 Tax=Catillopecten margaritatus gill symbiont TaxID=3083288 RepID=A0AAU6PFL1_9GAMM